MAQNKKLGQLRKEHHFLRSLVRDSGGGEEEAMLSKENARLKKQLGIKDGDPKSLVEAYMKSKGVEVKNMRPDLNE